MATCGYCSRPAFAGGKKTILCDPHFELWLIVSHLKGLAAPVSVATIQAEMVIRTASGHVYSFDADQVPELLAQMAPELQGALAVNAA